ncbi:hypothetical protein [Paenibacillus pinihumi]|uniref:hypothetical protein n=1 Tax=Paenibacillus pinihumi TaxID=669462 RepID=UPI0005687BEB|nr:hypothetical protein [Paenibacillus pinihumi]
MYSIDPVALPKPPERIACTHGESLTGIYSINDGTTTLEISINHEELYLTVSKMYGVPYKFKLLPVSHEAGRTTCITEMIHEQLVFHYVSSGEAECLEYTDYYGVKHIGSRVRL